MSEQNTPWTPGPWSFGPMSGWAGPVVRSTRWGERPIATLPSHGDVYYRHVTHIEPDGGSITKFSPSTEEGEARAAECEQIREANARLIAAAPEMAELLEQLLALHVAHHNNPLHGEARALLSRIRGEGA